MRVRVRGSPFWLVQRLLGRDCWHTLGSETWFFPGTDRWAPSLACLLRLVTAHRGQAPRKGRAAPTQAEWEEEVPETPKGVGPGLKRGG